MTNPEIDDMLALLNAGFPRVEEMTGAQARAAVAARRQPVTNLDDVASADDVSIEAAHGQIPARVYRPHGNSADRPVVVFFHGGGFVFCDLDTHDGFCRAMARGTDAVVVSVDYRLAPEHRAPAAAEDAFAATRWAIEHAAELGGDPHRVVVMGDSAGGNLAAAVCLMARDDGGPMPAAQVLVYPVIDPACDSESAQRYATGYFNTLAATRWYWTQYLPDDGVLPEPTAYVAPLTAATLSGLPPAIVVTAGLDPLCSEGEQYAAALADAGVPVVHRGYDDLFHGFLTILSMRAAVGPREQLWGDLAALLERTRVAP
ncbi:alpha/beta hydrolase [Nocardioides sp. Root140]|uniref:alpha/beta hydrolase n=1 Tax=Nocardioides sp. Root140 TaxID=1736460 RepID=UPI0006F78090|nr:alpha/beta hydrolase [Nocardioides sp. Root140]KQY54268.1 esterase [Nocardioides sp. Root140]